MNANTIINEEMTLEEKLSAIDNAMKLAIQEQNVAAGRPIDAPIDPSELLTCEGCQ